MHSTVLCKQFTELESENLSVLNGHRENTQCSIMMHNVHQILLENIIFLVENSTYQ